MRIPFFLIIAVSLCALSTHARAAEWLGPNLVTNGDFPDSTGVGWTVSPGPWQFFPASFAQVRGQNDEWLRQTVPVEPGQALSHLRRQPDLVQQQLRHGAESNPDQR